MIGNLPLSWKLRATEEIGAQIGTEAQHLDGEVMPS